MYFRCCVIFYLCISSLGFVQAEPLQANVATSADTELNAAYQARRDWFLSREIVKADGLTPQYINNLIYSDSPYLLSHAIQPVNWFEWQSKFEQGSGENGKLLFISIGYSTCHWCHVMAEESFDDPDIANILNDYYVSVKVDREQWPLVDHKFKSALEALKGEAGWPLNVILTPDGKLVWIDSYLTKDKFMKVIAGLAQRWEKKPQAMNGLAQRIEQKLSSDAIPIRIDKSNLVTNKMWREELPKQHERILRLLQQEQQSEGPRFIRANWGIGLLEEYLRTRDKQLLSIVESHVNNILMSPTYDAIEGGFHRYAVDGQWTVPHYEKMLYTQANTIRLLARLFAITGNSAYKTAIEQTHDWVTNWLEQESGYASAVSAISAGHEGRYYQVKEGDPLIQSLTGDVDPFLSVSVTNSNKSLIYLSVLTPNWSKSTLVSKAKAYRDTLIKPTIDEKVLVSWNSLYAIALLEAYDVTREPKYYQHADILLDNLWGASVVNEKAYRSIFHRKASIDATLEDYAWFALAQIKMSFYQDWQMSKHHERGKQVLNDDPIIKNASARAAWLLDRLTQALADDKQYQTLLNLSRDDELSSIKATVYNALSQGYKHTQNREYKKYTKRLAAFDMSRLDELINQYSFVGHLSNQYQQVAINNASFAKGHGRITAKQNGDQIVLKFDLQPGWHVNANQIANDKLIPTSVTVDNENYKVIYPTASHRKLGFIEAELALYEGTFEAVVLLYHGIEPVQSVSIQIQACSDKVCLLPEIIQLYQVANL